MFVWRSDSSYKQAAPPPRRAALWAQVSGSAWLLQSDWRSVTRQWRGPPVEIIPRCDFQNLIREAWEGIEETLLQVSISKCERTTMQCGDESEGGDGAAVVKSEIIVDTDKKKRFCEVGDISLNLWRLFSLCSSCEFNLNKCSVFFPFPLLVVWLVVSSV